MNEKIQFTTPQEKKVEPVSEQKQARFDTKVLETLVGNFTDIEEQAPEQDKETLVQHIFKTEKVKSLLNSIGVRRTDDLAIIIGKIEKALAEREKEKTIVRFDQEPAVETQAVNDNEKPEIINVQERLNELYRQNNESINQEESLGSILARLEIFNAEKSEDERVKVVQTEGGEVEVLFEEDEKEAQRFHQLELDIQGGQERIAEYEKNLSTPFRPSPGLLGRFFGSSDTERATSPADPEFEGKKMRTQLEVGEKIKEAQELVARLESRKELKDRSLKEALLESGIDTFTGTWGELLKKLQEGVRQAQESLKASLTPGYETRDQEIAALEKQRAELEDSRQVA